MAVTRRRVDAPLVPLTVGLSAAMKKTIVNAAAADGVAVSLIVRGALERGLAAEVRARNNARAKAQQRRTKS